MRKGGAFVLTVFWALLAGPASALEKTELELELDPYYSDVDLTIQFSSGALTGQLEQEEMSTYRDMAARALVPRFLVVEASVNPLPAAGVILRNGQSRLYRQADVTPSLNLVEAVTAGFEEPYALSLFFGNVMDFSHGEKTLRRRKKGFVGYLLSGGNYHIMENIMVPDNWLETEAKIKGDLVTDKRKISWSFRAGEKSHSNREITDVFYLGLRRDRIDYVETPLSLLLSTGVDYRASFRRSDGKPIGHYLMLEKNIPFTSSGRNFAFSMGLGYQWLGRDQYTGSLAARRTHPESRIMLRPNLKF